MHTRSNDFILYNHKHLQVTYEGCCSKSCGGCYLRVSSWSNKVEAHVDACVVEMDEVSPDLQLLCQVLLKLLVDVCHHSIGGVLLVDLVAKASSAHNR